MLGCGQKTWTVNMTEHDISSRFLNKKRFTKMVEQTVFDYSMSYMEAILHLCEKHGIEVEDSKKYISPPILEKIKIEAIQLNFLEGETYNAFE